MRKKEREVTDLDEIIEIMQGCDVCRLGLNDEDGYPYVVPLNFGLQRQAGSIRLYFHGATEGHKLDLIRRDEMRAYHGGKDVPFNKAAMGRTAVFALDVEEITGKRKEAKVF